MLAWWSLVRKEGGNMSTEQEEANEKAGARSSALTYDEALRGRLRQVSAELTGLAALRAEPAR
jgi:hypothetical protein